MKKKITILVISLIFTALILIQLISILDDRPSELKKLEAKINSLNAEIKTFYMDEEYTGPNEDIPLPDQTFNLEFKK